MIEDKRAAIAEAFNKLWWHDSKMHTIVVCRNGSGPESTEEIHISLQLLDGCNHWVPREIVFKEVVIVDMRMNLIGKEICSDQIGHGKCLLASPILDEMAGWEGADIARALHFRLVLIDSGSLDIIAMDFELQERKEE